MLEAAKIGNVDGIRGVLKRAVQWGMNEEILNAQDEHGTSALQWAIRYRKEEVAIYLISNHAQVNTATNSKDGEFEGSTPLISASFRGMTGVVKQLLIRGGMITAIRKNKSDAAFLAAQEGHLEILQTLVSKDSTVADRHGLQGRTPLAAAAWHGQVEVMKYLLEECGARVDAQDEFNDTPLTLASESNKPQAVRYLLEMGADSTIKGEGRKTALEIALHEKNEEVIRICSIMFK